jgi:trehalose-phosphatase
MRNARSRLLNTGSFQTVHPCGQQRALAGPLFSIPQHAFATPTVETLCKIALHLFLALDYDGTLVSIASHPQKARPSPALLALLAQLAQLSSVTVTVMSGRPLVDLCPLLPVQGIAYVGTHGFEIRTETGETRFLVPPSAFISIMSRLQRDLAPILASSPWLLLEHKQHALALHYRQAPLEEGEHAVKQFLTIVRAYQKRGVALEVIHGKKVVEVRPLGVNKGKAVQSLLEGSDNKTLPLYIGDDATDEDAFKVLNGRGITILVAEQPRRTAAQYYLKDPEEVFSFLSRLLALRQSDEQLE